MGFFDKTQWVQPDWVQSSQPCFKQALFWPELIKKKKSAKLVQLQMKKFYELQHPVSGKSTTRKKKMKRKERESKRGTETKENS